MGVVVPMHVYRKNHRHTLKRKSQLDIVFKSFVLEADEWFNNEYWKTFYEGYPYQPPCDPFHPKMKWYFDTVLGNFGMWVIDLSEGKYGDLPHAPTWNPFVRRMKTPPFQPINLESAEDRKYLVWYVDELGYGQQGRIFDDGTIWVPFPRPTNWKAI